MSTDDQLPPDLEILVGRLRALGATVTWPAVKRQAASSDGAAPDAAVGQIWHSHKPGVQSRAILEIGPHPSWSKPVIWFAVPGDPSTMPRHLSAKAWRAWVQRSSARPAPAVKG